MADTLQKLLDAAENRMRLYGYHAVSFRDLADDLGIKSASVHYHFRQKEDLGAALVDRYAKRFFACLEDEVAKGQARRDAMTALYRAALVDDQKHCLCGLLAAEAAGLPAKVSAPMRAFFTQQVAWAAEAWPDLPPDQRKARAAAFIASMQGALLMATGLNDPTIFDEAVEGLGGLRPSRSADAAATSD
jgi:TetR/AcrR family transcriptional repressor of nem operon